MRVGGEVAGTTSTERMPGGHTACHGLDEFKISFPKRKRLNSYNMHVKDGTLSPWHLRKAPMTAHIHKRGLVTGTVHRGSVHRGSVCSSS